MSVRVIEIRMSDLSGNEGANHYVVPGFELDLTPEEYAGLMEFLAPYQRAGKRLPAQRAAQTAQTAKVPRGAAAPTPRRVNVLPGDASKLADRRAYMRKVREWANANNYQVSARGVVAAKIVDAYELAHSQPEKLPEPEPTPVPAPEPAPEVVKAKPEPKPKPEAKRTEVPMQVPTRMVREWWKENHKNLGLPTPNPAGRIPITVMEMYRSSHALGDALRKVDADGATAQLAKSAAA